MDPKLYAAIAPKIDRLSKIPGVNWGGCGFVALHLYDYLTSKGYKPKILGLEYTVEGRKALKRRVKTGLPCPASHFVVKVGSYVCDAYYGIMPYRQLPDRPAVVVSREYLTETLKDPWMWNPRFDRKHVPTIRRILKCEKTKTYDHENNRKTQLRDKSQWGYCNTLRQG